MWCVGRLEENEGIAWEQPDRLPIRLTDGKHMYLSIQWAVCKVLFGRAGAEESKAMIH